MVAYLDAAVDRLARRREAQFDEMVEATRAGTIFAHDAKAYGKWTRRTRRKPRRGLSGEALEAAVSRIAALFPGNVVHGAA